MEKCIGCELCAGVCPSKCIYVRGSDNPPDSPVSPGERYGYVYEINLLRCIFCGLCVEACPTTAITMSNMFEFSVTQRSQAIFTKEHLLVTPGGKPQLKTGVEAEVTADALHETGGWMRATSPGGDAEFEGYPLWSGEAGVGVPDAEQGQASFKARGGANRAGRGAEDPAARGGEAGSGGEDGAT